MIDSPSRRAPYPGLRPFHRDEGDLFFGREGSVNEMVDRAGHVSFSRSARIFRQRQIFAGQNRTSRCARSGTLWRKAGSRWQVLDFHPGAHPLQSLARALLGQPNSEAELNLTKAFLTRGPRSVIEWCLDGNLAGDWNFLLLIDQFEELFRYRDYAGREEVEAFVALLIESADEEKSRSTSR